MEEWKNIIGYEGLYEVSNKGNVRNVRRNTLLRLSKNQGYIQVYLYKNGIRTGLKVHRLVAQAFIPNPDNLPCVNHKDETRNNNDVRNLEWCTQKYNCNYGTARQRNSIHNKGKKLSQETKDKMSASRKGKKHSIEWCEKISLSNKGKVSPNKGKKMSEEQKEKIRNSVKKSWELRKKVGIE